VSLPYGWWPVLHTFGIDHYRVAGNPQRELWNKYWWNDSPQDPNWPVFVEGVAVPLSQAPSGWRVMGGLLDRFPRTVYYGGPTTRSLAGDYAKLFQNWAERNGWAYETAIVPVQPRGAFPHPRSDFAWYIANETRPPTRYRFIRKDGDSYFHWVDVGYDTGKYADFRRRNPTV